MKNATIHCPTRLSTDDEHSQERFVNWMKGGEWGVDHFDGCTAGTEENADRIIPHLPNAAHWSMETNPNGRRKVVKGAQWFLAHRTRLKTDMD